MMSGLMLTNFAAAIMKEDATGQRYLQVKHFISRGVPSSIITMLIVVTVGYGAMRIIGL
jgi:phosphate transporter